MQVLRYQRRQTQRENIQQAKEKIKTRPDLVLSGGRYCSRPGMVIPAVVSVRDCVAQCTSQDVSVVRILPRQLLLQLTVTIWHNLVQKGFNVTIAKHGNSCSTSSCKNVIDYTAYETCKHKCRSYSKHWQAFIPYTSPLRKLQVISYYFL